MVVIQVNTVLVHDYPDKNPFSNLTAIPEEFVDDIKPFVEFHRVVVGGGGNGSKSTTDVTTLTTTTNTEEVDWSWHLLQAHVGLYQYEQWHRVLVSEPTVNDTVFPAAYMLLNVADVALLTSMGKLSMMSGYGRSQNLFAEEIDALEHRIESFVRQEFRLSSSSSSENITQQAFFVKLSTVSSKEGRPVTSAREMVQSLVNSRRVLQSLDEYQQSARLNVGRHMYLIVQPWNPLVGEPIQIVEQPIKTSERTERTEQRSKDFNIIDLDQRHPRDVYKCSDGGREFRCFVYKGRVCAISQYIPGCLDGDCYDEDKVCSLVEGLLERVSPFLPPSPYHRHCVMDVFIWSDLEQIKIIEFNPWLISGSCMYDWDSDHDAIYGTRTCHGDTFTSCRQYCTKYGIDDHCDDDELWEMDVGERYFRSTVQRLISEWKTIKQPVSVRVHPHFTSFSHHQWSQLLPFWRESPLLIDLNLSGTRLSRTTVTRLADVIATCPALESLLLRGCGLIDVHLYILCTRYSSSSSTSSPSERVITLDLRDNKFTQRGLKYLDHRFNVLL